MDRPKWMLSLVSLGWWLRRLSLEHWGGSVSEAFLKGHWLVYNQRADSANVPARPRTRDLFHVNRHGADTMTNTRRLRTFLKVKIHDVLYVKSSLRHHTSHKTPWNWTIFFFFFLPPELFEMYFKRTTDLILLDKSVITLDRVVWWNSVNRCRWMRM